MEGSQAQQGAGARTAILLKQREGFFLQKGHSTEEKQKGDAHLKHQERYQGQEQERSCHGEGGDEHARKGDQR